MKRILIVLWLLLCLVSTGNPVLAADPIEPMVVDIVIVTGEDADVGIDIDAGRDANVSVNSERLATMADLAVSGPVGTAADLFTFLEVRRLSGWSRVVEYNMGWLYNDLARNIGEDQEYRLATDAELIKIGFEQGSQDFLIELNQSRINSLSDQAKVLTATDAELRLMIEAQRAHTRCLQEKYDNALFGIFLVGGVFLVIIFSLVIGLLRRTI